MTTTTPIHPDARNDRWVDRRVDVQIDGRKAVGKDGSGAFVIVLANHEGAVTKTTSTANLGVMLSEAGRRVLIVDWTRRRTSARRRLVLRHPRRGSRTPGEPEGRRALRTAARAAARRRARAALARVASDHPVHRRARQRRRGPAHHGRDWS